MYLRYANPIYKTSIKILIKEDDDHSDGNLSSEIISKIFSNGKANISNELEVVKSQTLLENVVRKLSLNQTFYGEGNVNTKEIYDYKIKLNYDLYKNHFLFVLKKKENLLM